MWTGQQMTDLAALQQQSRQSINLYVHHCGSIPLRPVKWPFVSSSSSEVKLSAAQPPRILTASSALCPNRPPDPQTPKEIGQHLNTAHL